MCLQKGESCTLTCTAECENTEVLYRWYLTDQNGKNKTLISEDWSKTPDLEIEPFLEKGICYYICEASTDKIQTAFSEIVAAAYTGLSIVKIETVNHEVPVADYADHPEGAYGATLRNATKVPSAMQIVDKDGKVVYDSKDYDENIKTGLTIKLRGNTSARGEKKPYKLKLQTKADLLSNMLGRSDKKYKDKEWILLNKDEQVLNNFIGMAVADILGTPWTPEFAFVDVIINGEYQGIYLLSEAVNRSEKRVDVSKDGYIIERDAYWWNEEVKFITSENQKYTFKYPDDKDINNDETLLTFIKDYMETVECQIKNGTYEDYIDTESFARWQLVHDILGTLDAGGSNIYMSKYDNTTSENPYEDGTWSKIMMSTPWDFDSNYLQKDQWSGQHGGSRIYSGLLFNNSNCAFFDSYQSQWNNVSEILWTELSKKLNDLKVTLGEEINIGRKLDAAKWNRNFHSVESNIESAENWFTSRIEWLNKSISEMQKAIYPDFTSFVLQSEKKYDGNTMAVYSGNIGIENPLSVNNDDEVFIKIVSVEYNSKDTDADKITVTFVLDGKDKDKYSLICTTKDFPASILENPETATFDIVVNENVKIWSFERTVYVENAAKEIIVFDMMGRIIKRIKPESSHMKININNIGFYIVKADFKTQKVLIR